MCCERQLIVYTVDIYMSFSIVLVIFTAYDGGPEFLMPALHRRLSYRLRHNYLITANK